MFLEKTKRFKSFQKRLLEQNPKAMVVCDRDLISMDFCISGPGWNVLLEHADDHDNVPFFLEGGPPLWAIKMAEEFREILRVAIFLNSEE